LPEAAKTGNDADFRFFCAWAGRAENFAQFFRRPRAEILHIHIWKKAVPRGII